MTNARQPDKIAIPVGEGTAQMFNVRLWLDERRKTADPDKSYTVRVVFLDPGGSTYGYACASTATSGLWTFSQTGANHTTVGEVSAQVHVDAALKGRSTFDLVSYL